MIDQDRKVATVNLNDYAFVRLTAAGIAQFHDHHSDLIPYGFDSRAILSYALQPNGEYRFQIHELMLIFGPVCYNGSNRLPFENNSVRIEMWGDWK